MSDQDLSIYLIIEGLLDRKQLSLSTSHPVAKPLLPMKKTSWSDLVPPKVVTILRKSPGKEKVRSDPIRSRILIDIIVIHIDSVYQETKL